MSEQVGPKRDLKTTVTIVLDGSLTPADVVELLGDNQKFVKNISVSDHSLW